MHGKMMEMKEDVGGMMQSKGMIKNQDREGRGGMMGDMSEIMGDMGHMMESGKMTPEQMSEMSKMMGVRHDEADVGAHGTGHEKNAVDLNDSIDVL